MSSYRHTQESSHSRTVCAQSQTLVHQVFVFKGGGIATGENGLYDGSLSLSHRLELLWIEVPRDG